MDTQKQETLDVKVLKPFRYRKEVWQGAGTTRAAVPMEPIRVVEPGEKLEGMPAPDAFSLAACGKVELI